MQRLLDILIALCRAQFLLFPRLNTGFVRCYGRVRLRGHWRNLRLGRRVVFLGDATLVCDPIAGRDMIELGPNTVVEQGAYLNAHGGSIKAEEDAFIGVRAIVQGKGGVYIGACTMLGPNAQIYSSDHGTAPDAGTYRKQPEAAAKVRIGANVWLGANVVVLKGSDIADHSIVAAGAIVRMVTEYPALIRSRGGLAEVSRPISTNRQD